MATVLGLDIGTKTITGAVLTGKAGSLRLADFFVEEIPSVASRQGDEEGDGEHGELGAPLDLEQFLEKVIRDRRLNPRQIDVVAAVDTKDCIVREFPVPFTRDDLVEKTLFFESETHFPGVDLESATLEYIKVQETEDKSRLLVWALENEKLERRLGLLRSAGIDPVALDIDAAALFNAFALTPAFDPERNTLVVDMGATSTRILLVEKGELRKVRALRLETALPREGRLIPQPVGAAASGNGSPSPVPAMPSLFEDEALDSRFQEIEKALRQLDPDEGSLAGSSEDARLLEDRAVEEDELDERTIAIVSDEDYLLLRDESEDEDLFSSTESEAPGGAGERAGEGDREEEPALSRMPGRSFESAFDYRGYLERIASEIQRSVAALRLSEPIELLCLTGGMSGHEEARAYLAEELGVETVHLDFGESLTSDLEPEREAEAARVGAVAVGLGAKLLEGDRLGVDFRKGPYRYEHKFEQLRFPLLVGAVLFFLFSLQAAFFGIREWQTEKSRAAYYRSESVNVYRSFFGEKPRSADLSPLVLAKEKEKKWKGGGVQRDARYLDFTEAVKSIGDVLKSTNLYFVIDSLNLDLRAKVTREKGKVQVSAPTRSRIMLEASDVRASVKIDSAFRSPRSTVFDADTSMDRSRGRGEETYRVTVNLTVKESKLKDLQ